MIIRIVLAALIVGGIAFGIFSLQQQKADDLASMSSRSFPPAAVTVAEVQQENWRQTLFAVGSLAAEQGIDVVAPLPGSVVDIRFESGQDVKRLQPLLHMDVGIQQAELEGLVAARELRMVQFDRAKRLLKDKQISQSDYDAARAALDEAEAEVHAKEAYIARKTVYAPFAGTLGIRMIDLGTYLEPGDPIVPLQLLDPIHVDYAVPEQFLSRLNTGQPVELKVPAYPGEVFKGAISAFDPGIDEGTRTVRIRATLANPDRRLRPGMFAEVWTIEADDKKLLTLPQTAVTYSPYGNSIFVVADSEGKTTVERRQVQTGEVRDGRVEISSGVELGERIVAVGQNKLRNGMPVDVVEDATVIPEVAVARDGAR